jgi:hypothetical protein
MEGLQRKAEKGRKSPHTIRMMNAWMVSPYTLFLGDPELLGGVEMEEKGERYRDGEKVCLHPFVAQCELMTGIEVLREGIGAVYQGF